MPHSTERPRRRRKAGAATRTLYRIRYWRPGWSRGRDAANTRLFWREPAMRRFVDRLEAAPITPAGAIRYEISTAEVGPWTVRDEVDTGAPW